MTGRHLTLLNCSIKLLFWDPRPRLWAIFFTTWTRLWWFELRLKICHNTVSHRRPTDRKSCSQILSSHSPESVWCLRHCESSDPSIHPLISGLTGTVHWFESYLKGRSFRDHMERRGIQSTSTDHRGSSGFSAWNPPLFYLHHITGTHHTGTWFLLPLLW